MGEIRLNTSEQLKLEVVYQVSRGELSSVAGQQLLNVSERTMRRYLKKFREQGIHFVKHGNFGRSPANKTPDEIKAHVLGLVRELYYDFNVSHLREKLLECHNLNVKYETLRKWCHEIHHVKQAHKRRNKPRRYRSRMTQAGLMLQMDGSHHEWLKGRKLCLLALIDDATSETFARFYEGETSLACMDLLRRVVEKKGVWKTTYTDRAGVFGGVKREHFSQVERAMGELGSKVIYAYSPEAKGRVERLFKTLQDRLIPELRLQGINDLAAANEFLENVYLPHYHNPKCMVQAQNPVSAYSPLAQKVDLIGVFSLKEHRIVGRDHSVSIAGEKWLIADPLKSSIYRQKIELRYDQWNQWRAFFAGKPIRLVRVQKPKKIAA